MQPHLFNDCMLILVVDVRHLTLTLIMLILLALLTQPLSHYLLMGSPHRPVLWRKCVVITDFINQDSALMNFDTPTDIISDWSLNDRNSGMEERVLLRRLSSLLPQMRTVGRSVIFFSLMLIDFYQWSKKDNVIQLLFWTFESFMSDFFSQISSKRLFKHFKQRWRWSKMICATADLCYLACWTTNCS